jgi:integrase
VFTCEGDYIHSDSLRKRYYKAIERACLRRLRFHDLRHAFGSAAITKLDPYAVQSYMGHAHYSTTQRYLHHKPRREDAARLADAFGHAEVGSVSGSEQSASQRNSEQDHAPEEA